MVKKILVTGGAGYIGSHTVVELSNDGYEPIIVDNFCNSDKKIVLSGLKKILKKDILLYEYDCTNQKLINEIFEKEKIQGVIHFAALKAVGESVIKPLEYYQNNLGSVISILKAITKYGVNNFIFSSSACVYGQPNKLPAFEDTPLCKPESPYGNTKKIGEEIIAHTVRASDKLKAISLRYFNPIGAHETGFIGELPIGTPNNLVPFITQTAAGIQKELKIFGNNYKTPDGTCIRDFLHVVDLAKAHVKSLKYLESSTKMPYYDVFNLGTGQGNSVMEVVTKFEKENQIKLNYVMSARRTGDIESLYANTDKANKILNWKSEKTLEHALKDAWNWQKNISKFI